MNQHPYRTVLFLMFLAVLLIAAVALLRGSGETGVKMLSDVVWGVVGLGAIQGGKSSVQYLGAGGGVRGALSALLTNAKPGETPAPPPPG